MSTPMLTGVGSPRIITTPTNVGETVMQVLNLFDFSFTSEVTDLEAQAFNSAGILETGASTKGATTNTLTLSSQVVNWPELGFYINQFPDTAATVDIPLLKTAVVPTGAPYEIDDPGITALTKPGIYVYVFDGNDSRYRTSAVTPATPAVGEVGIDDTANKLIFEASDAGKTFSYTLPVNKTTQEFYGGIRDVTADTYGTIEFWGIIAPLSAPIHFPSLDFKTNPSFEFTGDVATLSVEFSANTPTGASAPYTIYRPE